MTLLLLSNAYTSVEIRLTEMLIGKNVSGYTASRSGRLFDEVMGVIYVSRPNFWLRFSQPFAACSDLKVLYGGQPADVRLLASPRLEGDINLLAWSKDAPDRVAVVRLRTSMKSDTITYRVPGFRLRIRKGKYVAEDTVSVVSIAGPKITCEEKEVRLFRLGRAVEDPTFVWTGKEIWVVDGGELYAYRRGRLVHLRSFGGSVAPVSNGEGTVAFYLPGRDDLVVFRFSPDYSSVKTETVRDVSRDVGGEFVSIHAVREVKKGEENLGGWAIVLTFRREGVLRYVKVKREGNRYVVESTDP